jgi:hypothetical protein
MKASGPMQKWGVGVLGVVSLVLLVNLVLQFTRTLTAGNARPRTMTLPTAKRPSRPAAKGSARKQKTSDELSRYDPMVKLDLLKELEARPLPELERNPFEFPKPPAVVLSPTQTASIASAVPPSAPPPPPPPPVSLKPMGYSTGTGGVKEAMVSDDDQIFVVHEGDSVGTRYMVIKITPTVISVEDAITHQTVDLPVPQ